MEEGKRQRPTRATMYSVETIVSKGGISRQEVVTHHLPWPKDSPKIEPLKARGYTLERQVVELPTIVADPTPAPGEATTITLKVEGTPAAKEKRVAALVKARAAKAAKKEAK